MSGRQFRWTIGLFIAGGLSGCGPSQPPAVAPPPVIETSSTDSKPSSEAPPTPVAAPVKLEPRLQSPAGKFDPVLSDLAARLIEPAGEGGWRISKAAELELERLGSEAPAKLLPLMGHERTEVRRGAAFYLLGKFDSSSREHVAAFTKALDDSDATIRGIGLSAVRQMDATDIASATPQLLTMFDPKHETKPENRAAMARFAGSLGQKGLPFARGVAKSAVNDPDERVRAAAMFAITQIGKPEDYLPTVQKGLADKHAAVRLVAAGRLRALGMQAKPAADELGKALADEDERVRTAAAEALVRVGVLAVPVLGEQLSSQDVNARKLALACLSSLGTAAKSELAKIEKLQQDQDADVREAAKVLAGRLKP
jgi:HEAT repeat protein